MADIRISRGELFGIPTWRSSVPDFVEHHDRVVADMRARWDAGEFTEHRYGYGYNTPATMFKPPMLEIYPYLDALKDAFIERCHRILATRAGHAERVGYEVNAVEAWVRIQTPEETAFPWHHHVPAVLSGCYFVQVPETTGENEGELLFRSSDEHDMFRPQMSSVQPAEGDLVIFPSYLMHMPAPSPSAKDWRVGVNMDLYVNWQR
jgi:Putative 2OG-Fe(II) oxygenase